MRSRFSDCWRGKVILIGFYFNFFLFQIYLSDLRYAYVEKHLNSKIFLFVKFCVLGFVSFKGVDFCEFCFIVVTFKDYISTGREKKVRLKLFTHTFKPFHVLPRICKNFTHFRMGLFFLNYPKKLRYFLRF